MWNSGRKPIATTWFPVKPDTHGRVDVRSASAALTRMFHAPPDAATLAALRAGKRIRELRSLIYPDVIFVRDADVRPIRIPSTSPCNSIARLIRNAERIGQGKARVRRIFGPRPQRTRADFSLRTDRPPAGCAPCRGRAVSQGLQPTRSGWNWRPPLFFSATRPSLRCWHSHPTRPARHPHAFSAMLWPATVSSWSTSFRASDSHAARTVE